MSEEFVLALAAAPINHMARPGTFGVLKPYLYHTLPDHNFNLIKRDLCEKDLNFRQVTTYVTLVNPSCEVLSFVRGVDSGDERVKGKESIGVGGHINRLPIPVRMDIDPNVKVLTINSITYPEWLTFLSEEAIREVVEEVGLKNRDVYKEQLMSSLAQGKFRYLCLSDAEEEQTHLAVHVFLKINPVDLGEGEPTKVSNRRWSTMKSLYEKHYDQEISLERLSIAAVDYHLQTGSKY